VLVQCCLYLTGRVHLGVSIHCSLYFSVGVHLDVSTLWFYLTDAGHFDVSVCWFSVRRQVFGSHIFFV